MLRSPTPEKREISDPKSGGRVSSPVLGFPRRRMTYFARLTLLVGSVLLLAFLLKVHRFGEDSSPSAHWQWSTSKDEPDGKAPHLDGRVTKHNQLPQHAVKRPVLKEIMPRTTLVRHSRGYNVVDNVYMANETIFFITDDALKWPALNLFTSSGYKLAWTQEERLLREPTSWHISFISEEEARERWGNNVWTVDGLTVFVNEPNQYMHHYFHWVAETWFGIQRLYASLDPDINVKGETTLEDPARFIFRHIYQEEWMDWARINWHITQTVFPSAGIEWLENWESRGRMTSDHKSVWRFNRMMMADRGASFRAERVPGRNHRSAWAPWEATQNISSRWWWEPIRRKALKAALVHPDIIDIPSIWNDWEGNFRGDYPPTAEDLQIAEDAHKKIPVVITYISRQLHGRRMIEDQEKVFVQEVSELCKRRRWKFNHAVMQLMSVQEQLATAAETTIMIGVHGNGLTHLVWMPLTPMTTVIEIFSPGGFAKDYEWTSRALGMTHYAIWNDTAYTHPHEPKVDYPNGFQGVNIPIHGPSIAKIIEDRVEGRLINM